MAQPAQDVEKPGLTEDWAEELARYSLAPRRKLIPAAARLLRLIAVNIAGELPMVWVPGSEAVLAEVVPASMKVWLQVVETAVAVGAVVALEVTHLGKDALVSNGVAVLLPVTPETMTMALSVTAEKVMVRTFEACAVGAKAHHISAVMNGVPAAPDWKEQAEPRRAQVRVLESVMPDTDVALAWAAVRLLKT
jgi:hypothetical protein